MPHLIKLTRRKLVAGFAASAAAGSAIPASAAGVCVLTPQSTEGPYYFDPRLERSDITEGRLGAPLNLKLAILDAAGCAPLPKARVDIWHADALGFYSGYDGQGDDGAVSTKSQAFMRGTQFADAQGNVGFDTVYPGWYRGRTTHIHFKVWLDRAEMLTGQIYFPDEISRHVYENLAPYDRRTAKRDTDNETDGVLQSGPFCEITEADGRYRATLIIAADRAA